MFSFWCQTLPLLLLLFDHLNQQHQHGHSLFFSLFVVCLSEHGGGDDDDEVFLYLQDLSSFPLFPTASDREFVFDSFCSLSLSCDQLQKSLKSSANTVFYSSICLVIDCASLSLYLL